MIKGWSGGRGMVTRQLTTPSTSKSGVWLRLFVRLPLLHLLQVPPLPPLLLPVQRVPPTRAAALLSSRAGRRRHRHHLQPAERGLLLLPERLKAPVATTRKPALDAPQCRVRHPGPAPNVGQWYKTHRAPIIGVCIHVSPPPAGSPFRFGLGRSLALSLSLPRLRSLTFLRHMCTKHIANRTIADT